MGTSFLLFPSEPKILPCIPRQPLDFLDANDDDGSESQVGFHFFLKVKAKDKWTETILVTFYLHD